MTPDELAELPPLPCRVDGRHTLLRAILPKAVAVWIKPDGRPSTAAFDPPAFSSAVERLTTLAAFLSVDRWPAGTRAVRYSAGLARDHGFDALHEPEPVSTADPTLNLAHANVYSADNPSQRKKKARKLAEAPSTAVVS